MPMSPAMPRRLLKSALFCCFFVAVISLAMSGRFAIALTVVGLGLLAFGLHGLPEGAAMRGRVLLAALLASLAACAVIVSSFFA